MSHTFIYAPYNYEFDLHMLYKYLAFVQNPIHIFLHYFEGSRCQSQRQRLYTAKKRVHDVSDDIMCT